jgi:tRNA(Ile)-lysidine synthase
LSWIDDPANESAASLRARSRKALQGNDLPPPGTTDGPIDLTGLLRDSGAMGQIVFNAADFHARPFKDALRLLAAAAVCAGGGNRLPRHDRVAALHDRLASGQPATLSGARLQQTDGRIVITREPGDIGRHGDAALAIVPCQEAVWDGRFALNSSEPGVIRPARGLRSNLSEAEKAMLQGLPAAVRDTLPVFEDRRKMLSLPALPPALVLPRFLAACGAFATERDLQELYVAGPKGL